MPPTSLAAQYIMWGMLVILVILMITLYFHIKGKPIRDDAHLDEERCPHCGETLDDYAEGIAKRVMSDPTHTPHN